MDRARAYNDEEPMVFAIQNALKRLASLENRFGCRGGDRHTGVYLFGRRHDIQRHNIQVFEYSTRHDEK
jgi:hypothetical protein